MRMLPRVLKVLVDRREKIPLLFPATLLWFPVFGGHPHNFQVVVENKTIETGDYLLAQWPELVVAERKGSVDEVYQNFATGDKARATAAFGRLLQYPHRVLVLEMSASEACKRSAHTPEPERAMDALYTMVQKCGLHVLWGGSSRLPHSRRALGEQMLRLMLSFVRPHI